MIYLITPTHTALHWSKVIRSPLYCTEHYVYDCSLLDRTLLHSYFALWHAIRYHALLYCITICCTESHQSPWDSAIRVNYSNPTPSTLLHFTSLHSSALNLLLFIALCCTALHETSLHLATALQCNTMSYCTTLHNISKEFVILYCVPFPLPPTGEVIVLRT